MILNGHNFCKSKKYFNNFFKNATVNPDSIDKIHISRSLSKHIWTFDDALVDIYEIYFKHFKNNSKNFHFFVCPDLVDKWEEGDYDYVRSKLGNPNAKMLGWKEINELIEFGNIIGSHGLDHSSFSLMSENESLEQLESSKQKIFNKTGKLPNSFAFPYGYVENRKFDVILQARKIYSEVYLSDNTLEIGKLTDGVYNRRHSEFGTCVYRGLLMGCINILFGIKKWRH